MANNCKDPKHLYEMLKKGDKAIVKYCNGETLKLIPTLHEDTILHLAISMGQQDIATEIVKRCCEGSNVKLLMEKNALGNTVLHEAAATSMINLVEELLQKAPTLLSIPNNKKEMPLYTAAYYGQINMFKLLADKVGQQDSADTLDGYLQTGGPKERTTILHAAIHAEFFELALLIAYRYHQLIEYKDKNGLTGLQLLSCNPSAFRSGAKYGPIKSFIYYCAPYENVIMDEDGSHKQEESDEYMSDLIDDEQTTACFEMPESRTCLYMNYRWFTLRQAVNRSVWKVQFTLRQAISSVNRSVWKVLQAWGTMKRIYEEKKRHESAFKLAKLLITADFSWDSIGAHDDSKAATNVPDPEMSSSQASIDGGIELHSAIVADMESIQSFIDSGVELHSTPPTPLLLATSQGILEIVDEILRVYPLAVEHTSDMEQSVLHFAIMHRRWDVFQRVIQKQTPKSSRLLRGMDVNDFTILHHVGNMNFYKGGTQPGPALQLQEELKWFEEVEKLIPQHYKEIRAGEKDDREGSTLRSFHKRYVEIIKDLSENIDVDKIITPDSHKEEIKKNAETPIEYFRRTHDPLLKSAQEWLKRTSESCSTVAGLMATVAFAAALTVPGGNDNSGAPRLLHNPFFLVFIITDALSLASSLTSLVMFLSILTSPFELHDFRHSLPGKLILGFTFLFFSVAVSMLAFASTLMLTIPLKKRVAKSFIYCVAFLPVTMFALLQFPLWVAFKQSLSCAFEAMQRARTLVCIGNSKITKKIQ